MTLVRCGERLSTRDLAWAPWSHPLAVATVRRQWPQCAARMAAPAVPAGSACVGPTTQFTDDFLSRNKKNPLRPDPGGAPPRATTIYARSTLSSSILGRCGFGPAMSLSPTCAAVGGRPSPVGGSGCASAPAPRSCTACRCSVGPVRRGVGARSSGLPRPLRSSGGGRGHASAIGYP